MSTTLLRRYSPSPLACGSGRVELATPSPSRPTTTKLSARRLGKAVSPDVEPVGLGEQGAEVFDGEVGIEPVPCLIVRAHSPTLALPPLSPERAPMMVPRGRRRLGPAGQTRRQACPSDRSVCRPIGCRSFADDLVCGVGYGHPPTVGVHDLGDDQAGRHQRGPVDAVDGTGRRRRAQVESGVAGQRQFGGRSGEGPAHPFRVGVLDGDPQLGGGLDVGWRVRFVRADEPSVEFGELLRTAQRLVQRAQGELRLLLDVQPGEDEGHRVAPSAQQVEADLHIHRGGQSAGAGQPDPVRSHLFDRDGVEAGHHIGVGVVVAVDLVEELGGDGAHRHLAAGARVLGDHRRAVLGHLGDGEAGMLETGDLGEERVVAAGGLGAALDDMAGHHGSGQPVPVGLATSRGATPPARPPARRR